MMKIITSSVDIGSTNLVFEPVASDLSGPRESCSAPETLESLRRSSWEEEWCNIFWAEIKFKTVESF